MQSGTTAATPKTDFFNYDNADWYKRLLLHMRYALDSRAYENIAGMMATFLNRELQFGPITCGDDAAAVASDVEQMQRDGYCKLGQLLNPDEVAEVRTFLAEQKVYDGWERAPGDFLVEDAPPEVSVAHFRNPTIVECPHLVDIASHPRILARVAGFLGAPPTIQFFALWWSLANRPAAKDAQLFHVDRHCYRFLKLFVYLNDVDTDGGPHVLVRGTGYAQKIVDELDKVKRERPAELERFQKMARTQRKSDQDVSDLFGGDRIVTITGKAGEAFLVNTAGYHKGLLPKSVDRLSFQALYTMLPTIKDAVEPLPDPGLHARHRQRYGDAIAEDLLAYMNRLVIAP